MAITGAYGTLTLAADGSYSYVRAAGTPGGVSDTFTYTLTDGDGDTSTTTLTIAIGDSGAVVMVPTTGPGTIVDESGLPPRGSESPGSDAGSGVNATNGTITYHAPDGPATVAINGVAIDHVGQSFTTAAGTLVITSIANGAIGDSYTLTDNTAGDTATDHFVVTVTDLDGDSASAPLVITIIDDVPHAVNDVAAPAEDTPVTINVMANDIPGADSVNLATGVALATGPAKGTVVYNGDGTFTYTPTPGQEGGDSFTYTITDGDGDKSTATVTITLAADSVPTLEVSNATVEEAALPIGSNPASTAETATGTIAIGTGHDSLATLIIGGVDVTAGGSVVGASGILTVTVTAGVYGYSYTLASPTAGDAASDNFTVAATDSDGDVVSANLHVAIVDDVPTAHADTDAVAAGTFGPETGNVMTGVGTTSGAAGIDGHRGCGGHAGFRGRRHRRGDRGDLRLPDPRGRWQLQLCPRGRHPGRRLRHLHLYADRWRRRQVDHHAHHFDRRFDAQRERARGRQRHHHCL